MPSAQVIDFGADPYANAMGGFAKSFLGALEEKSAKRRNDELFDNIKSKYGKDAKTEDILWDVISAEGMDESYKTNLVKNIKEYGALKAKKDKNFYEDAKLIQRENELVERQRGNKIAEDRLDNDTRRTDVQEDTNKRRSEHQIRSYISKYIKDNNIQMSPKDISDLNYFVEDIQNTQDKSFNEAFRDGL